MLQRQAERLNIKLSISDFSIGAPHSALDSQLSNFYSQLFTLNSLLVGSLVAVACGGFADLSTKAVREGIHIRES